MNRRQYVATALAMALLAGCQPSKTDSTSSGTSDSPKGGSVVVFQQQQEPEALNPIISSMMATINATTPLLSALVNVNEKMEYFADLAETVPTVANGGVKMTGKTMVVTYKIKKAKWHDGKDLTSEDVKFTWRIYNDPTVKATSRDGYDKITKIETPDPQTAVVYFKEIFAPYLGLFGAIMPKHLLEADLAKMDKPGDSHFNSSDWNRHPIGSGPFKFKDWATGDHISYEAFKDYYGGKPKLDGLVMKIIPDENTAFVQLKSGDIDIYQSAALTQYDQLKGLTDVTVLETPGLTYEHLDFNLKNPILADKRVRQAIAWAIDKDEISQKIYKGLYKPAYGDQAPLNADYYNKDVETRNPKDFEKAKKLLDEAGWVPGSDGIRAKGGKRLSFEIVTTTGRKPRELTEQVLLSYLKQIGVELKINNVPGAKLFGRPDGLLNSGTYELALYAWVANPDPNNIFLWNSKQQPPNGQNYTRYSNPEVDKLTTAGNLTVDVAERGKIYKQIQSQLADDLPMIPLLYWTELTAVNKRVAGFKANPTSAGNLWNCQEWAIQ